MALSSGQACLAWNPSCARTSMGHDALGYLISSGASFAQTGAALILFIDLLRNSLSVLALPITLQGLRSRIAQVDSKSCNACI